MALPSDAEVDDYIWQKATQLGIDPTTAVRISRAERADRAGGWLGDYVNGKPTSFGPFQLHIGGEFEGFSRATGLDARDMSTWKQQVDYALMRAKQGGWGPWNAAKKLGIGVWDGIRGAVGTAASALGYYFPIPGYTGNPKNTYHTPGASDLMAPEGTPIRAIIEGRVISVTSSGPGGNSLEIMGKDGLTYYYAHMRDKLSFAVGDLIAGGQRIGLVGRSGITNGADPHLHIGIGYGITEGSGRPDAGAGRRFDAQGFLANLLNMGGSGDDPVGVATDVGGALAGLDIGGGIRGALGGAMGDIHQGIFNYVQNRTATIVLMGVGIFLVLAGLWGMAMQSDTVKTVVKTGIGMVGGPVAGVAAGAAM